MKKIIVLVSVLTAVVSLYGQVSNDANRLMVIKDSKVGYIDTTGGMVLTPSFTMGNQFSEDLASVVSQGNKGLRYAFINDKMDIVITTLFDAAGDFSEGLARVQSNGKWGYINKKGNMVIDPQFQLCYEFNEGYAQAQKKGKWGVINKKGEWVIQPEYNDLTQMGEGLLAVQKNFGGKWYFVDVNEKIAFTDSFDRAGFFCNGLAPVRKNDKWGYINKKGEVVVDYLYTGAREFSGGLACVEKEYANWGFINTKGDIAIGFQYDRGARFRYNHALVEKGNEYGYINKSGVFIWKSAK
jgi:hypothetical protein